MMLIVETTEYEPLMEIDIRILLEQVCIPEERWRQELISLELVEC
ncbi:hypothetical protein PAECIP111893_03360 [Paenibacillus plantiphilus]|uniref:Uncharacterized protein n=1 Tax=Paenibacillus plantiphilus TaxID=2905650 RepID=A0ABM9CGT0_9BACL|nr:hypothetical protein [Paenibacillus plantiphilus]CAH1211041.1 hypothetical protein PAECIP111893_03360 [Paenibacillus plantiphilus]